MKTAVETRRGNPRTLSLANLHEMIRRNAIRPRRTLGPCGIPDAYFISGASASADMRKMRGGLATVLE